MVNHPWLKYVDALVMFKRFDAQHRVHPTGESPRFQAGFWLEVGSVTMASSRPAHPRVTQAVGRFAKFEKSDFLVLTK